MRFRRNIEQRLEEALSTSPAVLLTGARQTGKTTLVEEYAAGKSYFYATFDDIISMGLAKRDPKGFIEALHKPAIIDEVQRVPEIFLVIKRDIDQHRIPGRYILTGSANPLLLSKVRESLAGRLETLSLFPLSQGELLHRKEDFIATLFSEKQLPLPRQVISKGELYERIIIGGYPPVQGLSESRRSAWFRNYATDILIKDVQAISKIESLTELPNLLKFIAYRAGHSVNKTDLADALKLSSVTVQRYLTLLETLYMINFCQPWRPSQEKRIIKTPRIYLIDTGILAYLQGLTVERLLAEPVFTGHIIENFVWGEITKQATWSMIEVKIYYFRTASGVEVDIILEDLMGQVVGIEIKNSSTVAPDDFKGLKHLQQLLGKKFVRGVVLYTGNHYVPVESKLAALPFSSLWQEER
jgi:uncharacterized protein